jgi:hypothetical protein
VEVVDANWIFLRLRREALASDATIRCNSPRLGLRRGHFGAAINFPYDSNFEDALKTPTGGRSSS